MGQKLGYFVKMNNHKSFIENIKNELVYEPMSYLLPL